MWRIAPIFGGRPVPSGVVGGGYPDDVEPRRRRGPFIVLLVGTAIVCLAVFRLPGSLLSQLSDHGPLDSGQAGWAYRLLVFVAIAQAVYGAFGVLQSERVRRARERDSKVRAMSREEIVVSLARNAAGMCALTLVYGIASLVLTGQRGGFWLFPGLVLLQAAWYYRQVGDIARWIELQPAFIATESAKPGWNPGPPDYTPPIARGLSPSERENASAKR
jgi:hypothetical protein